MKKVVFIFLIVLFVLTPLAMQIPTGTKNLADTFDINPKNITKLTLNIPYQNNYKSTTDKKKINAFIHYFNQVTYDRLRGDVTAYMPTKASIIYVYGNDKSDFIVPYEKEVMISHKVYKVENGVIENDFIIKFYNSLDRK
ncbi:hypothetical protein [Oceanobacillus halotolerans]|uniref:hypothetical protein n=1 Tax=Oceanobacillus halotolerans TaxID=2663380 RepID=UPI0013DB13B2|nr:hypothetical protein [Oceanobacillus halotolerans]